MTVGDADGAFDGETVVVAVMVAVVVIAFSTAGMSCEMVNCRAVHLGLLRGTM